MQIQAEKYDVGVVVGRFQVHELHDGHRDLLDQVTKEHDAVVIVLGLAPVKGTVYNPLDFRTRAKMLREAYPEAEVMYLKDTASDELWSQRLDKLIADVTKPSQKVALYGSRDSFIDYYSGQYDTFELAQDSYLSGTEVRKTISNQVKDSAEFRAGVIYNATEGFASCVPTVDCIVYNDDMTKVLLGRKADEKKFRVLGGYANAPKKGKPTTWENTAIREVQEEAGIPIHDLKYIGSFTIDDWRYKNERDGIVTTLFTARMQWGRPQAGDDIAEVRWFDVDKLRLHDVMELHHPLIRAVGLCAHEHTEGTSEPTVITA